MPKKKTKKEKQEEKSKSNGQTQELEMEDSNTDVDAPEEKEEKENDTETLEELSAEDELNDLRDRHLRLRAEFDNYRKRSEKEYSRLLQYEGEEVILSFLGIADDLQRMLDSLDGENSENFESLLEGITLINDNLHRRLSALKVEPFDSEGVKFDPEIHDAMMTQSSEDHEDGVVIQEFEKGYKYKDRVIRHAKVIVNSKAESQESE
ncbi:MAG: nucleotide exchange factor GrpE [Candidatus Marinimicrobia bacterium]|nr:nucleotide exchange factor GrpE [Candidatus Neomarinimicrobiota bacterium]|tara:strand:- start:10655 stop:11275 length:621 start_codon:yes stop_codon:yes gene_type:complete